MFFFSIEKAPFALDGTCGGGVVASGLIVILRQHPHLYFVHSKSMKVNRSAPSGPMSRRCLKDFLLREAWGLGQGVALPGKEALVVQTDMQVLEQKHTAGG